MIDSPRVRIISQEVVAKLWSTLTKYVVEYTDRNGKRARLVREVNDHGMAAAVLAYDPKRKTVLLVKQFRFGAAVAGYADDMIEVCAGLLDGDTPEVCALKEAREELGANIRNLQHAMDVYVSPGALTERLSLFMGEYSPEDRFASGGGLEHEGEDIEVFETSFDEAYSMIAQGRIVDAKTIILLQHLKLKQAGLL